MRVKQISLQGHAFANLSENFSSCFANKKKMVLMWHMLLFLLSLTILFIRLLQHESRALQFLHYTQICSVTVVFPKQHLAI